MTLIRELKEQRAKAVADAQALIPKNGEPIPAEKRRRFEALMDEADQLKEKIERLELGARASEHDRELRKTVRPPEALIGRGGFHESENEAYRAAFLDWVRNGPVPGNHGRAASQENLTLLNQRRAQVEQRDMGVGTGNLGGYFVPQGFVYDIEQALKYYGNMLGVAKIMDTATGNPLPYPTSNDVLNVGEIVAEGSQVTNADVSVGHLVFGAFKFSTKMVRVSLELLQDSAFDMEGFLAANFAERLGRILNTKFTVGAGTTEPMGIITAATAGPTAVGSAANTGGSETGGTSVGYVDLVALEHSVDPLYRRTAKFMMHDSTLRQLQGILDKYGRPIWVPGVASNAPDTILGYEYSINNDMDQVAVNKKTVAFGAIDKYLIRRVKQLSVLRLVERFADYGQVAFLGFARYDGNLLDAGTHPVKYLVQAAA
jgi:HK97 family phage major capsid protein